MPRDWPHPLDPPPSPAYRRWLRAEMLLIAVAVLVTFAGWL